MDKKTKLLLEKGESLPIMEAFYTIQGEGFHKGSASYFIRTANVRPISYRIIITTDIHFNCYSF